MKNASNWKLIGVLAVLAGVFLVVKLFRSPLRETNIPQQLTTVDTTAVTEIIILPARQPGTEIHLQRSGKIWKLAAGEKSGHLEQGAGPTALASLMNLHPDQIVSRRRAKWNDFNVGDSTGTRVRILAGEDVMADLWIGRTEFKPSATGGMFEGGGSTYVRVQGEEEVYAVPAFLDGQFNRPFDDWRDKTFTRIKRDSIDRIAFQYPADSSFVLERRGGWFMGSSPADSSRVAAYLNGLEYKNVNSFAKESIQGDAPVKIEFQKRSRTVATLEAWPSGSSWTIHSSYQPDTYFTIEGLNAQKDVWKGRKEFTKKSN